MECLLHKSLILHTHISLSPKTVENKNELRHLLLSLKPGQEKLEGTPYFQVLFKGINERNKTKHIPLGKVVLLFKPLIMPLLIYPIPQETSASPFGPLLANDSVSRGNSISSVLEVSLLELYHIQAFFFPFFDGGKMQDGEKALTDITILPLNYKAIPVGSLRLEYALGSET